jgi:hypothetical protein
MSTAAAIRLPPERSPGRLWLAISKTLISRGLPIFTGLPSEVLIKRTEFSMRSPTYWRCPSSGYRRLDEWYEPLPRVLAISELPPKGSAQWAPRLNRTIFTVRANIMMSNHTDQLRT